MASRRAKVQIMEKRYLKLWVSGVTDGISDGLGWCFSGSSENSECPLSDSPSACVACSTHPTVGSDNSALLFIGRVCEPCSRTPSTSWRNSRCSLPECAASWRDDLSSPSPPSASIRYCTNASSKSGAFCLAASSAGVPTASTRPLCIKEMRSQRAASFIKWVETKMVILSSRESFRRCRQNISRAAGSTPEVGSSRINTSG